MVNFRDSESLVESFNLNDSDLKRIEELFVDICDKQTRVVWVIQRVWIDEQLSDNAKCFLIFTLGKFHTEVVNEMIKKFKKRRKKNED